jgi:hypothetical protein
MAHFYDISSWNEKKHLQTGGTRNKSVVENPETLGLYFFKTSLKKEKKDYKYEFWSEIIASKLGQVLGFNVLDYNIAQNGEEVGCLSKLMNEADQSLFEGINYLQGFDPNYIPEDKSSYRQYTFQFICEALQYYYLDNHIEDLIKTIIFDSLIGNGDRHQENWGFIISDFLVKEQKSIPAINKSLKYPFMKWIFKLTIRLANRKVKQEDIDTFFKEMKSNYAPIYDSGSCLGRELENEKVDLMLKDPNMLNAFINRGTSEIHWDGNKLNHFQLIRNIYDQQKYKEIVQIEINRIKDIFNEQIIKNTVDDIDKNLPESLFSHKLPENRKELITKIVSLRYQNLQSITL